jgi:hypothetical protein
MAGTTQATTLVTSRKDYRFSVGDGSTSQPTVDELDTVTVDSLVDESLDIIVDELWRLLED